MSLTVPKQEIAIYGDSGGLSIEASLPKILYGNNLMAVTHPEEPLLRLQDFVRDHVEGDIPDLAEMDYQRVDYCHNFHVGSALRDYVRTLSNVSFLKHHRTTDGSGGVEWYSDEGRRIRAYDKHKEILEKDEKDVPEARGILRFEIQLRKKTRFLERRLKKKNLTLQDVLTPKIAYCTLVETLNAMCLGLDFQTLDSARDILGQHFSYRKATQLLGLLHRLQSETMEDVRRSQSRSTYYADKAALRKLGLWPPSAGVVSLPALAMPPVEDVLSADPTLCDSLEKERWHRCNPKMKVH
jgi:hypothetical protein